MAGNFVKPYFTKLAALLEPLALEPAQVGTFTYTIDNNTTKYLVASFFTKLGSGGRMEVRDLMNPLPLRGVTLSGGGAGKSAACILDPSLPVYADAESVYYDRLEMLANSIPQQIDFSNGLQTYPFLPGAYGAIIINVTFVDMTWLAAIYNGGGWNLHEEIDDTYTQRGGYNIRVPVSKLTINSVDSGTAVSQSMTQPPAGTIVYVLLPASWGKVPDPTVYIFRDDFMSSVLDLTRWNRIQGSGGSIEIDSLYQWIKLTASTTPAWNTNTIYSKISTIRVAGKVFMADVFININTSGAQPEGAFGFMDGAGYDYSNFLHAVNFGATSITILESGSVLTTGLTYTAGCSYRIRITLNTIGAIYEMQGGTEFPSIGGSYWTRISVSSTGTSSPLYPGASAFAKIIWASDIKVY
jgi:hypothetical protein